MSRISEDIVYVKPTLDDIPAMQALVAEEVHEGIILFRDANEMANTIRSYTLARVHQTLIGFAALHIYSPSLAEIRSLMVQKEYRGSGVGSALLDKLEHEARHLGIKQVLTLTYRREFFEKNGFVEIPKADIPENKIWADCIKCKHFPICNEISLIKNI